MSLRQYSAGANNLETPRSASSGDDQDDPVQTPAEPLPENVFGVVISCFIRDWRWLAQEGGEGYSRWLKFGRLWFASGITLLAFGLQFYLIYETKELVTPEVVKHIRGLYGQYEQDMYTDRTSGTAHVAMTENDYPRGVSGYFNATNFQFLSEEFKYNVCRIPLSQPTFFFVVCTIWTMTCLSDMRENVSLSLRLTMRVRTIRNMAAALAKTSDDAEEEVVAGLTCFLKVFLSLFVFLPRFLLTGYLLWLGSRWLCATDSFADLIMNAVALEFILLLRELLYITIVPHATKVHTTQTLVPHLFEIEHPSVRSYFGTFILLLLAFVYSGLYMYYFQGVLPDYKWDVRGPCTAFLGAELAANR